MKIKPGSLEPGDLPHLPGRVYTRLTRWGPVVQAWPRKGKRKVTRQEKWWRDQFGLAGRMAADPIPLDLATATNAVKGSTMVPRDFLTSCIYGNGYEILEKDGTVWQATYKGPPPPPPTVEEDDMWEWGQWDAAWTGTPSSSAYCFKGSAFVPRQVTRVTGVRAVLTAVSGALYRAGIIGIAPDDTIATAVWSSPVEAISSGEQVLAWSLDATMQAGQEYAVMVGRIDGAANYALPITFPTDSHWLWPCDVTASARIAKLEPVIGDALNRSAVSSMGVGMKLSYL